MEMFVFSKEEKIGAQRVQINKITVLEKWKRKTEIIALHTLKGFKGKEWKTVNAFFKYLILLLWIYSLLSLFLNTFYFINF